MIEKSHDVQINEQRYEIIHKNFFRILAEHKLSFSKYAADNSLDRTLGSHWRSGNSKMTVDQIYDAAKYFKVTVNDLYYTEKELKRIDVSASSNYDPIIAQQSLKIKLLNYSFEHPIQVISPAVVLFIIISFLTYLLIQLSPYWLVLQLLGVFLQRSIFESKFTIEKNFIINYLDEIYYERHSTKNDYLIYQIVCRSFELILIICSVFSIKVNEVNPNTNFSVMLVLYIFSLMIFIVVVGFSIVSIDYKFKKKIDDYEIFGYKSALNNFLFSMLNITLIIILLFVDIKSLWISCVIGIILSVLSFIDFKLTAKSYSQYRLIYEEDGKEERELFSKKR